MNDLTYDQAIDKLRGVSVQLETVPVLKEVDFRLKPTSWPGEGE